VAPRHLEQPGRLHLWCAACASLARKLTDLSRQGLSTAAVSPYLAPVLPSRISTSATAAQLRYSPVCATLMQSWPNLFSCCRVFVPPSLNAHLSLGPSRFGFGGLLARRRGSLGLPHMRAAMGRVLQVRPDRHRKAPAFTHSRGLLPWTIEARRAWQIDAYRDCADRLPTFPFPLTRSTDPPRAPSRRWEDHGRARCLCFPDVQVPFCEPCA